MVRWWSPALDGLFVALILCALLLVLWLDHKRTVARQRHKAQFIAQRQAERFEREQERMGEFVRDYYARRQQNER